MSLQISVASVTCLPLRFRYVQYPHGMARLAPITTPGITDRYLADKIYGFPVGPAVLMASAGPLSCNAEGYASDFDHDFEIATPYYYEADLQSWGIKAEVAPSQEAAYYRFTFPAGAHAHLALSMKEGSELTVVGDTAVQGSEKVHRTGSRSFGQSRRNQRILLRGVLQAIFRVSNLDWR